MRCVVLSFMVALSLLGLGCTFYTACPPGNGTTGTSGQAGASGQAGGSSGTSVVIGSAPTDSWVNATANLAGMVSECGNLSNLSSKPDEDLLIAGIAQHGLWSSTDGGMSWKPIGTGKGSDTITNRTSAIVYDPVHTKTFWESGIYNGFGVYSTTNDGGAFKALGNATHNDFVSVDFSDPDRKTLLASQHEMRQGLLQSLDRGNTWTEIGQHVPAEATFCSYPLVLDTRTFLLGCGITLSGDGISAIYKSTDAGASWTGVSPNAGGASAPLVASDSSIYWVTQFGGGMVRSTDQGDNWTTVVGGNVIVNVAPSELPDGRIAVVAARHILVSADQGASFRIATSDLGFDPTGFVYSSFQKAFFAWHNTCSADVPSDGIMRYDFDYMQDAM